MPTNRASWNGTTSDSCFTGDNRTIAACVRYSHHILNYRVLLIRRKETLTGRIGRKPLQTACSTHKSPSVTAGFSQMRASPRNMTGANCAPLASVNVAQRAHNSVILYTNGLGMPTILGIRWRLEGSANDENSLFRPVVSCHRVKPSPHASFHAFNRG